MSETMSHVEVGKRLNVSPQTARRMFTDVNPDGELPRIPGTGRRVLTPTKCVDRLLGEDTDADSVLAALARLSAELEQIAREAAA